MKPKQKRSKLEAHLPHDVIMDHVLTRVPAKSVCRFRCVSKEWHSSLASNMFLNKHNPQHIDDHKNNPKLLVLYKTKTSYEFTTIDCEAPPSDKGLPPTRRPLPPFEGITTTGNIWILLSCHGLVCLGILDKELGVYSDLILWNPLTNEYKRLSKSNSHKMWYSHSDFGFYYSRSEDDYKLLFVNCLDNHVYIYSLKSDSWRKVDLPPHISLLDPGDWSGGTYLNENLYFLQADSYRRLSSIIRFDTKTERISKIETPNVDADHTKYHYSQTIVVKSDCIHVCVKYDININDDTCFGSTTCIKLWKLDDESGNMYEVVSYQLRPHVYDIPISSLIPFHLMKNGKWLMRDCRNHQIYKLDLKKKKMHYIKDKGQGNIYDDDDFEYANVGGDQNNDIEDEQVRYIETFVSPNRYMK